MADAQDQTVIPFDTNELHEIYDELGSLVVPLDDDPLAYGPKRLNAKVSAVRAALDRTEKLFLVMSKRKHLADRRLLIAKTDYDLAKKNLFANDPETRAGRSVSDREAIAAGKLKREVTLMNDLEVLTQDLEAVLDVIKAKRTDLKGTEARLKDQLRLCHEELGIGARWGSKVPEATVDFRNGRGAGDETRVVQEMIGNVDGEISLAQAGGQQWQSEEDLLPETLVTDASPRPAEEVVTPILAPAPKASVVEPKSELVLEGLSDETPTPVVDVSESRVLVALPETGDPSKAPVNSASADDVDTFIDMMPMEGVTKATGPKPVKHVALDDASLMDFLSDFESPEGPTT